jgi:hypothetical protein
MATNINTRKTGGVRTLKHKTLAKKTLVTKHKTVPRKTVVKKPATVAKKTVKRRSREVNDERHPEFQPIIDAFASPNILDSFAEFIGREDLKSIISGYDDEDDGNVSSRRRIPVGEIPTEFSGVTYDGAHWKGYEPARADGTRIVYDSYLADLQPEKTMNFCQSWAVFLWANHGNLHFNNHGLNITFKAGDYVENVKKMARIWLAWFAEQESFAEGSSWLSIAIPSPKFSIAGIKHTLRELSTNNAKADEFSKATL